MKASIIIPTRNRSWVLKDCIRHLSNQSAKDYEIIIIDDASDDNSADAISKIQSAIQNPCLPDRQAKSKIKYIQLPRRIGCWAARNVGIKNASGEIIIFVDSDVLVDKNFIADHLELHKNNSNIAVQGVVRHISRPEKFGIKTLRVDGICNTGLVIQNCSVPKQKLMDVGLFDEYKFMGYMDVELGMRIKKAGVKVVYAFNNCIAYHVDGFYTKEKLKNVFSKAEERGKTSLRFIERAQGKTSEGVANLKVLYLSFLLQTDKWIEKTGLFNLLVKSIDSPLPFIFPVLKELTKYHYRAKGIKSVKKVGSR
ncbi:MAG: glycosyltransferase [bacterium]|nr:glycosyltransferase [bacterium]